MKTEDLQMQLEEMSAEDLAKLIKLLKSFQSHKRRNSRIRGFEVARGFEGRVSHMPQRATPGSGGYDFWPLEEVTISPGESYAFITGVKAYMPVDEILIVNIRSSYGIKHNIQLCNEQGWIDSDYYSNEDNDGVIIIKVINNGAAPFTFKKSEPFAQGLFVTYHITDDDNPRFSARQGGIGHTTKN